MVPKSQQLQAYQETTFSKDSLFRLIVQSYVGLINNLSEVRHRLCGCSKTKKSIMKENTSFDFVGPGSYLE